MAIDVDALAKQLVGAAGETLPGRLCHTADVKHYVTAARGANRRGRERLKIKINRHKPHAATGFATISEGVPCASDRLVE